MRNGPCLSVPGVYSPPEEQQTSIHSETELLMENPEFQEAVYNLNYALAHAFAEKNEDLAWECFTDAVEKLRRVAKSDLLRIVNDPDYEEHA